MRRPWAIVRRVSRRLAVWVIIAIGCLGRSARAQERITLAADVLLYGDNTEFRNPFREGETLFGAAPRLFAIVDLSDRAALHLGVFTNQRFGSDRASELTRPVIALQLSSASHTFTFGTLPASPNLHGLLPPLQRETLAFERPYEAGFQWTAATPRVKHEAWLSWQQLNTPEHREQFDAGSNSRLRLSKRLSVPLQFHVVHHGGQQFAAGLVSDSLAGGAGAALHWTRGGTAGEIEWIGLLSRYVPDREQPNRSRSGRGFAARASAQRLGWHGYLLFWRGDDFIKEEGDPNFQSLRRDGSYYRSVRDYAEMGVERTFVPAPEVRVVVSGRLHRVEKDYGYSYRVLANTSMRWMLKGTR
jgi:hypothetical protein